MTTELAAAGPAETDANLRGAEEVGEYTISAMPASCK